MTSRRRRRRTGERAITIVAALLLCGLGFMMVRATLARSLAAREPKLALWWSAGDARALLALATARARAGDTIAARDLAVRGLVESPLQARALDLVALLSANRDVDVERIVRLAAARSLHDTVAHRWLYDIEAGAGQPEAALAQADVLARLPRDDRTGDVLRDLVARSGSAPFVDALVSTLGKRPPWRKDLLGMMASSDTDVRRVEALFTSLRARGGLDAAENDLLTARRLRQGLADAAYLNWISALSDPELQRAGLIYNGDFARQPSGTSFDWQITPVVGVDSAVLDGASGPALRVEFSGTRVLFQHVRHLLVLLPGDYRLVFEQRAEDLASSIGLVWRITCPGRQTPLATTPPLLGTAPWLAVQVGFTVPADCPLQELRLELPARTALDSVVSGRAAFRAFRIEANS